MPAAVAEDTYSCVPFTAPVERSDVVSELVWRICEHETFFSDYERACPDICRECEQCWQRYLNVSRMLGKLDTLTWEVWRHGETSELAGAIYLTGIRCGCDAVAHYCFFDGKLRSKTKLMNEVLDWIFSDHEGWRALRRLTTEVPVHAFALVRHAHKHLGFGGAYTYEHKGAKYNVEGVKRGALMWRGEPEDMLIIGKLNPAVSQ